MTPSSTRWPMPALTTTVTDIAWPAILPPRGAMMTGLLHQLAESEWWPADRIRASQFQQAARLLDHAARTVPYYADRLAGLRRDGAPLDAEAWSRLPILRRADLRDAGTALKSADIPKAHGPTGEVTTTGSTGMAVTVAGTAHSALMWAALTIRDHIWQARDPMGKLGIIRYDHAGDARFPDGRVSTRWGSSARWGIPTGPSATLSIETPVDRQAEWLARVNPDYLLTHPTNLEALARHCLDRGIAVPALKQAHTISEAVGPGVRDAARAAWGVPVADCYSAQEVGYMALQCPGHEHYLVQAEAVLLEVLDDDDRPCGPGEVGRVVVTTLHNFAMPLIRYDIGDYAEVGPPSPCGRGLPVLTRILGRTRSMLTLPGGGRIWPFFSANQLFEVAPVRQFQLVQKTRDALELHLVVDRPPTPQEETALRRLITGRLGHPFDVALVYRQAIPRAKGGKYEDFRSEVTA